MKEKNYSLTDKNLVFIAGYGNLPSNCALRDDYSLIVLSLLIDTQTDIVVDASVNTINELSVSFITAQLIGKNILHDGEEIIEGFNRYQAPALKSLIVAYKSAVDRYTNYMKMLDNK